MPDNHDTPITAPVLVIHGGAGRRKHDPDTEQSARQVMTQALQRGYGILFQGGSSLEAVVAAIEVLEDSPLFNAGRGSVLNRDGKIEMDASVMEGHSQRAGAVAGVRTIKNPIAAAHRVMTASPHVMLIGEGAEQFAAGQKLALADPEYFYTTQRRKQWQQQSHDPGTVGAVALDCQGHLAAGTSSGGLTGKYPGRVGDSAIIGAGTYADELCAISTTGHGECFIRKLIAYDIAARMKYQQLSLENAIRQVSDCCEGGIIALDHTGNVHMHFNTELMYRGFIRTAGQPQVFLYANR